MNAVTPAPEPGSIPALPLFAKTARILQVVRVPPNIVTADFADNGCRVKPGMTTLALQARKETPS